jgi:hypothetical protein
VRVAWVFSSTPYYSETAVDKIMEHNPVELFVQEGQPEFEEYKTNNTGVKTVFRKKADDPRLIHSHKLQLTYSQMTKLDFDLLNNYTRFWGQSIYLKLYQFDAKDLDGTVKNAALCHPKGDGTYYDYFVPYRNLSNDSTDVEKTNVWAGTDSLTEVSSSDYTIDYADGKIAFDTEQSADTIVKMNYVWRPKVVVLQLDPRPVAGKAYEKPRYAPVIILREL